MASDQPYAAEPRKSAAIAAPISAVSLFQLPDDATTGFPPTRSAQGVATAVRSFVRFLSATGRCSPGMEYAIPGFTVPQISSVPRFLIAEDVERLIASCPDDGL
jgi:hypothetical protein